MPLDPIQEYVQNMKKQVLEANKGVFRSSKEYNAVMKGMEDLDRLMTEMVQDKTIEGRLQKIENVRQQMELLENQIDAYMEHSNQKKSLDAKAQKRVNALTNVRDQLKGLRYFVDDKEIEMNALQAHNDTVKMQGDEKLITNTKNLYKAQVDGLRGKAQLSAKGALAAAGRLHELAQASTGGRGGLSEKEVESAKKCMATLVLHEMITGPNGDAITKNMQPNTADYKKKIQQIAGSKEFADAFNSTFSGGVSPEALHNFLTDYKSPQKMEKLFSANIHKTAEKKAAKTTTKTVKTTKKLNTKKTITAEV